MAMVRRDDRVLDPDGGKLLETASDVVDDATHDAASETIFRGFAGGVDFRRNSTTLRLRKSQISQGAGIVAMPEELNDPHLGVAVPDLVSHAISPRACRDLQEAHRRPSSTP